MATGTDFTFSLHQLDLDLAAFAPAFDRLPPDHYITGDFRYRRLSRFRAAAPYEHLPHQTFMQSGYVNRLLGNIQREYDEIEDSLIAHHAFRTLLDTYTAFFGTTAAMVLGVHQIRIRCAGDHTGEPAPEGIHQDGFDWIGIFCLARQGVEGGLTQLFDDPHQPPVFSKALRPGDAVFVNDRRTWHYTTPVAPSGPGEGHRDVFVITAA